MEEEQEEQTIVRIKLPRPHKHQQAILNSKARWVVVCSGRRFGKSLVAMISCLKRMLAGQQCGYITPTFNLGKTFYNEFLKYIPASIITSDNKTELTIKLSTGGSLSFFSAEAVDAQMRGKGFDYLVCDEAAFDNLGETWDTVIRPTLSIPPTLPIKDGGGSCLFISTPRGKDFFYTLWMKGKAGVKDYESFHFKSSDNPYFTQDEWDAAKESMIAAAFQQEYEAIPSANLNNAFGSDYINANIITQLSTEPTVVYGIDVARTYDYTVITGLDAAGKMSYFDRFQMPWEMTKLKIEMLPADTLKVMDSTGVGSVLLEALQLTCTNLDGFVFTTESKPKLMYELIKSVEKGELKYNQTTADEMHVFEYKYSSTGHISFSAISGMHDDTVCAIAMCNRYRHQAIQTSVWKLY